MHTAHLSAADQAHGPCGDHDVARLYMFIRIIIYMYMCICIYIYIYRERDIYRERYTHEYAYT